MRKIAMLFGAVALLGSSVSFAASLPRGVAKQLKASPGLKDLKSPTFSGYTDSNGSASVKVSALVVEGPIEVGKSDLHRVNVGTATFKMEALNGPGVPLVTGVAFAPKQVITPLVK